MPCAWLSRYPGLAHQGQCSPAFRKMMDTTRSRIEVRRCADRKNPRTRHGSQAAGLGSPCASQPARWHLSKVDANDPCQGWGRGSRNPHLTHRLLVTGKKNADVAAIHQEAHAAPSCFEQQRHPTGLKTRRDACRLACGHDPIDGIPEDGILKLLHNSERG